MDYQGLSRHTVAYQCISRQSMALWHHLSRHFKAFQGISELVKAYFAYRGMFACLYFSGLHFGRFCVKACLACWHFGIFAFCILALWHVCILACLHCAFLHFGMFCILACLCCAFLHFGMLHCAFLHFGMFAFWHVCIVACLHCCMFTLRYVCLVCRWQVYILSIYHVEHLVLQAFSMLGSLHCAFSVRCRLIKACPGLSWRIKATKAYNNISRRTKAY